jgi:SAM-dependent methyltransferase
MVVNKSRVPAEGGKSVADYGALLNAAFSEMRRVLRPKGRASVVFHNSDDEVWSAMLGAAEDAGLQQVEVSILDKVQRSMKGYRGRAGHELVPFYDLVITFAVLALALVVSAAAQLRYGLRHRRSKVHVTMVQLPGLNTPQFDHCLSKMPRHPMPVPPLFQPEIDPRLLIRARAAGLSRRGSTRTESSRGHASRRRG